AFTEIAQRLGFCSVHHFSRTFSRIAHLTPREYARSVQSRGML
ncbi:MAG TPA: AraC family transcriptional regulator, partial [Clostridiales bacterium]|nr:AraC family transcriptional regulator [Clostridiales bacterium]